MTDQPAPEPTSTPPTRRGLIRRFRRDQDGATAVEFALVITPFLALLLTIIETAMLIWTSQALDDAVTQASRTLLTGQSTTTYPAADGATANTRKFRDAVCANGLGFFDCSKVQIDVRSYGSFAAAQAGTSGSNPISGGALNTSGFGYNPAGPGQIIVVRAVLEYKLILPQWSVMTAQWTSPLANIGSGRRAIVASTAFKSEPFVAPAT